MKNSFKADNRIVWSLVERNVKIFLKDKMGVFFSLLAPLIILGLYVLFLGDVQMQSLKSAFEGLQIDEKLLKNFVDNWMLAGVISVSCVTVSFSAQEIVVKDREKGVLADMLCAPAKRYLLTVGYYISNVIITLTICMIVLLIAFVYMAISGWTLSAGDVFMSIGLLIMSVISSSAIISLICKVVKTSAQHGALVGIISAAIGFLIGAYMPISIFPKAIQYITLFIPATYSAGLYRELFLRGALENIEEVIPQAGENLEESFSMQLDFFGKTIGAKEIAWIFFAFTAVILVVWLSVEVGIMLKNSKKSNSIEEVQNAKDDNEGK